MTFWEARDNDFVLSRFVCAECSYDAVVRRKEGMIFRFDCLFCGWGCFFDMFGWWHMKTTGEWILENEEELANEATL